MQNPRGLPPGKVQKTKPYKKKPITEVASPMLQIQTESLRGVQETMPQQFKTNMNQKRMKKEVSPSFQQPERSTSDSLPDSSQSENEYRALRRNYLQMEEESSILDRQVNEVENEVKNLEDEKNALLDQLVVLEGYIDPSEFQSRR